jgi:amino-acid N-acetyltransferase
VAPAVAPAGASPVALVRDVAADVRRAGWADVSGIVALVAEWASEGLLLPRSAAEVAAQLDGYVVAVDAAGRVLACAAVREYAPSLAEVVSVAVAAAAHGRGLGRRVVRAAEALARVRGHSAVFAHTLQPEFFEALGYECTDRALYPEKRARAHTCCFRRALGAGAAAARPAALAA